MIEVNNPGAALRIDIDANSTTFDGKATLTIEVVDAKPTWNGVGADDPHSAICADSNIVGKPGQTLPDRIYVPRISRRRVKRHWGGWNLPPVSEGEDIVAIVLEFEPVGIIPHEGLWHTQYALLKSCGQQAAGNVHGAGGNQLKAHGVAVGKYAKFSAVGDATGNYLRQRKHPLLKLSKLCSGACGSQHEQGCKTDYIKTPPHHYLQLALCLR